MSQIAITVNGLPCASVRFLIPWIGLWLADIEVVIDADKLAAFQFSGPAIISIGATSYPGTIDPLNSASFADRLFLRVVGGQGGWNQVVPPKQYYSQNGALLSTDIYRDTALAVGELSPLDPTPQILGANFERMATSAAQVFGDLPWYVNPTSGVVNVAPWPSATPDDTFVLQHFHPVNNHVVGACDTLFLPGTSISDPRLNGATLVARTVEQTFTGEGSRLNIWCSANPVERLSEAFTIACRQAVNTAYLKVYQYRYVLSPSGTDLALQAITAGAPDLNPISQWQSLSGANSKYAPSTVILVGFTADNPPMPYLVSTSPLAIPLEVDLNAQTKIVVSAPEVDVGPTGNVNLGGGATALVPAPWADALKIALAALASALTTGTLVSMSAGGTALSTALTALPPDATTKTKAT